MDNFVSYCPREKGKYCCNAKNNGGSVAVADTCNAEGLRFPITFFPYAAVQLDDEFVKRTKEIYSTFPPHRVFNCGWDAIFEDDVLTYKTSFRFMAVRLDCFGSDELLGLCALSSVIPIKGLSLHSVEYAQKKDISCPEKESYILNGMFCNDKAVPIIYMKPDYDKPLAEDIKVISANMPDEYKSIWEEPAIGIFLFCAEKEFDVIITGKKEYTDGDDAAHNLLYAYSY